MHIMQARLRMEFNVMISERLPRILAINDLSGFGRCSLSVIMPILSVMKVQVCPLPTTMLSTHTGNLGDVEKEDLTNFMINAFNHYKVLNIDFDMIYTGYLSNEKQIDICKNIFKDVKNSIKIVDPVMGDNGILYKTFNPRIRDRMNELCKQADIITPNLTEALILLNEQYLNYPITTTMAKSYLFKLSKEFSKKIIITGVHLADGKISNIAYDAEKNTFWRADVNTIPTIYHGTGDMFTAIIAGSLINNDSLPISMCRATKFLELAVRTTYSYGNDSRYGLMFEHCLNWLFESDNFEEYSIL